MLVYYHFQILSTNLLGTGEAHLQCRSPINGNRLQNTAATGAADAEGLLCELAVLNASACGCTAPSTLGTLSSEAIGGIVPSSAGRAIGRTDYSSFTAIFP